VDISYTGLEADVAVTRDISPTISGWFLVFIVSADNVPQYAVVVMTVYITGWAKKATMFEGLYFQNV